MSEKVDILLATYQGAHYLEEQLESILTQSYPFFHIWVRDDGSTDQTTSILQKWAAAYPKRFTILPSKERLTIKGNFSALMKFSQASYVMFSDQDDVWLRQKVELSLDHMKEMERKYGIHQPLCVHTDLKVVDQNLRELSSSFWYYSNLKPEITSLNRLLTQNVATGCTMLMNRALVDLAYPIPQEAVMHDWWIALVAACFGHIHFLKQPTILYRQHSHNDTGAKPYSLWEFIKHFSKINFSQNNLEKSYQQAAAFLDRYQDILSEDKRSLLKAYHEISKLCLIEKGIQVFRYQFFKHGFLRNAKMLLSK